jgi:ElaB/YqjD/DUF883 family membrane-anchored ribosome-binding protein
MAVNVVLKSVFDDKGLKSAQQELGNLGKGIGIAFAAVSAAVVGAGIAIARFGSEAITAAEEVRQADNRLGQVAQSMGLFGAQTEVVTKRLIEFAEANELNLAIDAETIKLTQSKLLTFKQLATSADETGGAFDRATMAALDLAAAGFGSAETNATQLGKALQDPIKGLTALTRSGVTFTKQEKENIKVLVESGQTLKAQDLILQAIETQVGGTAEATAKSSDKMKLAFENVYETVGEALLPAFDDFTQVVTELTPQIADALVPIAEYLAVVFKNQVLPAIQDFTKWLASPQGTQKVKELTDAVFDGIGKFVDFTGKVIDNFAAIKSLAIGIGTFAIAFGVLRTALQLATVAQTLFNAATLANPYVAAAVAIATLVAGIVGATVALTDFSQSEKLARESATGLTGKTAELVAEQVRLKELLDAGVIGFEDYEDAIKPVQDELGLMTKDAILARLEVNKLNNIDLSKFRSQLGDTRVDGEKLVANARELAYYMNGGKAGGYKPLDTGAGAGGAGGGGGGAGSGKSAADEFAETRKKVQKIIQDAQKRVAEAQKTYTKAVAAADKAFLENELKIRQDYGNRLADIIEQSKNRIRDAYKSIAQFNISTFLTNFQQVEDARLQSFNDAKKAAEDVGTAFIEVFTKGDPVQAYLNNLREKIASNKKILDTSAKLLEAGFSQTFIEQIIATGETGGIALAEGLLLSSPETIREVQALFKEIESVAGTGADALANQLFEKQGLATAELVTLFDDTNKQLLDALAANYADYTQSLTDAGTALKDSLTDIRADFNEAIDEMGDKLGGLGATVKAFRASLLGLAEGTIAATNPIRMVEGGKTSGAFIPEAFDIDKALGLPPGGFAASQFPTLTAPAGNLLQNTTQPTTVINVNVRTDQTQSTAQVGSVIANAINKYTANGGKLAV